MALTPRWYRLRPHLIQNELWHSKARFIVLPCGRRSGKSEIAKRKVVLEALNPNTGYDDPNYFVAAPTRDQAKRIYWRDLKLLIPPQLVYGSPSETELTIRLVNGASISVVGMDKPERIEGSPWNGGILDEYADMKPQAWPENVRPALSDRNGWCWLIGVPEGRNHYYDIYKKALEDQTGEWAAFTWKSSDILPEKEIISARAALDELTFQQEYEASFVSFEGRVYYPFLVETHTAHLRQYYRKDAPLIFCFDFNVDPGVAAICQEVTLPNGLTGTAVIGEVYIPANSNTPAVCRKLIQDWESHEGRIACFGDASGGNRGSAKVQGSDWDLIKAEFSSSPFRSRIQYCILSANPPERARVNAVNCRLKNASEEIRLMVDPVHAPHVVKDFEGVKLLNGGSGEIDKRADPHLSHISDALGYYIAYRFPLSSRFTKVTSYSASR